MCRGVSEAHSLYSQNLNKRTEPCTLCADTAGAFWLSAGFLGSVERSTILSRDSRNFVEKQHVHLKSSQVPTCRPAGVCVSVPPARVPLCPRRSCQSRIALQQIPSPLSLALAPATMLSRLYVLTLWLTPLAVAVGPVVQCEPCDSKALEQCKPPGPDCAELVQESLCGCCWTCALTEGSRCGVYSQKCGTGLQCRPGPDEPKPLHALLMGRGVCANVTGHRSHSPAENFSKSDEDMLPDINDTLAPSNTQRMLYRNPQTKIEIIRKEQAKNTQRYKVDYDPQSTDMLNSFSESKHDMEYGPCRREMESVLNHLKIMNILSPRGLHIPNCDKKGFYKKRQCRPSKGRKRGNCWCVDKYGQPLPGYDVNIKGDANCFNLENK